MSDARPHILFSERYDDFAVQRMGEVGRVTVLPEGTADAFYPALSDCDALLIRTRTNVTAELLGHAPKLRVIGRAGVGLDNVDLEAARKRGIVVVHTPYAATDAVADLTVSLILALLRRVHYGDVAVRTGEFLEERERSVGAELGGLTLGIVGMGRIGQAVARRCRHGFGTTILYNDIVRPGHLDVAATSVAKESLYAQADVVTLHVPLTDQTRTMIDARALASFKQGGLLINTSRGAVVDGLALARALSSGHLGGAALDVFEPEPPPPDHPILSAPNTLFTPHIGARSFRGLRGMNEVVDDVIAVLQDRPPRFPA